MGSVAKTRIGRPCKRCGGTLRYASCRTCVNCSRLDALAWNRAHPGVHQKAKLRRKYGGVGPAERDAMLAAQGGRCAICGTDTPDGKGWCLDHDHTFSPRDRRGHRAILCPRCNTGLGLFRENEASLLRAAAYLREHRARLAA